LQNVDLGEEERIEKNEPKNKHTREEERQNVREREESIYRYTVLFYAYTYM
jgi:hypothetical protein